MGMSPLKSAVPFETRMVSVRIKRMRCCRCKETDVERAFSHAAVSRFGEQQAAAPRVSATGAQHAPDVSDGIEIDVIP